MKKDSLSRSFLFQLLYQIIILVIPLILSPYLTRTLGSTALGIHTYVNSIAYYFVIFSMLGISRHGQRLISENAGNELLLRKSFWSLFAAHIGISVFAVSSYLIFVFFTAQQYQTIYLIHGLYVLSALFDITWLYYGLEKFRSIVIKKACVKTLECIMVFLFVKNAADIGKYSLITVCGILLGQVIILPQAIRLVPPVTVTSEEILGHIRPLLLFSISVIAVSLYTVFDKTLLGLLSTKESVAFYEYSNRIIAVPKAIVGVMGTIMFPRACRLAKVGDTAGQKRYIRYSIIFTAMISMAAFFGLLAISTPFAILYFGEEFRICGKIMVFMAPLVYIVGIGDIIRTQFLIPNHMDREFNACILMNSIINLILSILLIPRIGIWGAVAGTISAELFGFLYQILLCRKFLTVQEIFADTLPFFAAGGIMYIIIWLLKYFMPFGLLQMLLQILAGGTVFSLICLLHLFRSVPDLTHFLSKNIHRKMEG